MLNEQNRMDILSNNLANSSTVGYKKEGTTVHPFSAEMAVRIKDESTLNYGDRLGNIHMGVKIGENYIDFAQGPFDVTDNATDVAIGGDGFFAIEYTNKQGETSVKYTRDGQFKINTDGYLVTMDGDYVLNQAGALAGQAGRGNYIQVDPNREVVIDKLGNIFQDDVLVAQLGVIDFENYDFVARFGENMYDLLDGGVIVASNAQVEQGVLEQSNVETVKEMVELITITRAYESNQKVIQTIDNMTDKAVNQVGKI